MDSAELFSDDGVDDLLGDPVGDAQVQAGDDDEADDHAGRLRDLTAVGPLDALQLGPGGAQEAYEAPRALAGRCAWSDLALPRGRSDTDGFLFQSSVVDLVRLVLLLLVAERAAPGVGVLVLAEGLDRLAFGARDQRGLELVDPGVVE